MSLTSDIVYIKEWFFHFARQNGWSDSPSCSRMLQVKMSHTLRVAGDSRDIALALRWDNQKIFAAEAAGLLHDIARFPQFNKYKTFLDRNSFDHGEYAYNILCTKSPFKNVKLSTSFETAILTAVRFHNRKYMPKDVTGFSLDLLKLVRDADKLDILMVVRDVAEKDDYDNHPELLLGKDKNGPPTKELIDEILKTKSGSYEKVHSLADLNLLRLTWVYDINYDPSLELLKKRDLYRDLMARHDVNPDIEKIKQEVKDFLNHRAG